MRRALAFLAGSLVFMWVFDASAAAAPGCCIVAFDDDEAVTASGGGDGGYRLVLTTESGTTDLDIRVLEGDNDDLSHFVLKTVFLDEWVIGASTDTASIITHDPDGNPITGCSVAAHATRPAPKCTRIGATFLPGPFAGGRIYTLVDVDHLANEDGCSIGGGPFAANGTTATVCSQQFSITGDNDVAVGATAQTKCSDVTSVTAQVGGGQLPAFAIRGETEATDTDAGIKVMESSTTHVIPAVSERGLIVLALLLLAGSYIVQKRMGVAVS